MDHTKAPVLDAIENFYRDGRVSYTPPGHKHGRSLDYQTHRVLGSNAFRSDFIMSSGEDDKIPSSSNVSEAQELMADAVGADKAFFSTCGSSLSVKSCMLAAVGPGDEILINRDAHKSAISGLMLSGALPHWVRPKYDDELQLAHPPGENELNEALRTGGRAKAFLFGSPTDYGTCGDIKGLTDIIHEHDKVMIVDEAWGAVFPFHEDFPEWAMSVGADLCVTSVHKTGGGFEQSSVFHLQGNRIDESVLRNRMELLATTSKSTLIFAALDGWRRHMMLQGHQLLTDLKSLTERVRSEISAIGPFRVYDREDVVSPEKSFDFDVQEIIVDFSKTHISGYKASEWLLSNQGIVVGTSDHRRITALFTYADNDETANRFIEGMKALSRELKNIDSSPSVNLPMANELVLDQVMSPRDAFFATTEMASADQAVGRVSAEMLTPYPPGVPVIVPGEVFSRPIINYVQSGLKAGMVVQDAHDTSLETFRVVKSAGV